MFTTMKKVCNERFVGFVFEDILSAVNTPPTLPSQLLDLTIYGSSLIGPPRLIVTINFSDDFLWANDKSEIFLQYVDYMHESLVESCVVSPKLNPKIDARYICLCIFLTILFLQILKILMPMFFLLHLIFFMILATWLLLLLILLIKVVVNFFLMDLMLLRGLNVNLLLRISHC